MRSTPIFAALLLATLAPLPVSRCFAQTVEPPPTEAAIVAAPGVRRVAPAAPDWCQGEFEPLEPRRATARTLRDLLNVRRIVEGPGAGFNLARSLGDLHTISRLACTFPDDVQQRAWLRIYRQLIVNETGMPDTAIRALFAYALRATDRRANLECAAYAHNRDMPGFVRAEYTAISTFVCRGRGLQADQVLYWLDQSEGMDSELLRAAAAFVAGHFDSSAYGKPVGTHGVAPDSLRDLGDWINVRHDALNLDAARFERDLPSSRLTETERLFARVAFYRLKRLGQVVDVAWRARARQVPGLEAIITTLPEQAFSAWVEAYRGHREDVDAAYRFERALAEHGPGGVGGCETDLQSRFVRYAESQRPQGLQGLQAVADSPVGSVLAAALYRCEISAGSHVRAVGMAELLRGGDRQRGPRTAALNAARRAVAEARAANPRFPYTPRELTPFAVMADGVHWLDGLEDHRPPSEEGVVASAQPDGQFVRVTFRRATAERPVYRCTESNRIHRVRPDGTVEYRVSCVQTGTRTVDVTPDPVRVHRGLAGQLQAGRAIRMFTERLSRTDEASPAQVYEDAGATRLRGYLGVSLSE